LDQVGLAPVRAENPTFITPSREAAKIEPTPAVVTGHLHALPGGFSRLAVPPRLRVSAVKIFYLD
jgi:hypothetical protein